jgi:membrane protein
VLWRSWGEVGEANLFLIPGGVTYALILALFPGLAALVSLYGWCSTPPKSSSRSEPYPAYCPPRHRNC